MKELAFYCAVLAVFDEAEAPLNVFDAVVRVTAPSGILVRANSPRVYGGDPRHGLLDRVFVDLLCEGEITAVPPETARDPFAVFVRIK